MVNEFEGTKLGESKVNSFILKDDEPKKSLSSDSLGFSLRGTTLGEESEFEKSLKTSLSVEMPIKHETTRVISIEHEIKKTDETVISDNPTKNTIIEDIPELNEDDSTETISESEETNQILTKEEPLVKAPEEITPVQKELKPEIATEIKPVIKKQISKVEENIDEIYGMALQSYSEGDIINGTILTIEKAGIFVDINYKCEGFVSNEELANNISEEKSNLKIGETILLFIIKLETKEGYTLLSKKRADWEQTWKEAYQSYKLKEPITVTVVSTVKGGLVVTYKGLRGFIPSSLVKRGKNTPLNDFINQEIPAIFIEVDKKRKKIILSNKVPNEADIKTEDNQLEKLEVGQVLKGKVTSIKDFGAFVNIDGIEGLIHISELSWDRIEKVEDLLTVGETLDVFILGIDKENRKISLGRKQLTPDPWEIVEEMYPIGKVVSGKVSRITTFGAFFKLDQGLEGLIHISELSHDHVKKVEDVVAIGQKLEVKVIRINPEQQKIGLSLKQMTEAPEIIENVSDKDNNDEVASDTTEAPSKKEAETKKELD